MAESTTLSALSEKWLQESLGVIGEETLAHYRNLLQQQILPWFGEGTAVSADRARAFIEEKRGQGLADNTIAAMIRVLRRVLEYGASLGPAAAPGATSASGPAAAPGATSASRPAATPGATSASEPATPPGPEWDRLMGTAKKKYDIVILTPAEEKQLCDYLIEHPSGKHLCFFLMLTMGLGIGETLELQWKDVSIPKSELCVRTQRGPVTGRKQTIRTLPLGERQKIYLKKLAGLPETYIATGTSRKMGRENLENRFRGIIKEQLLPAMSPTCLRHTYAVRCIKAGLDYDSLSKRLGLENGSSFRRLYRSLVPDEQVQRLERERLENRKPRRAPEHLNRPRMADDAALSKLQQRVEAKKKELQQVLDCLEGDLRIINALRNSDCVQGAGRQALYNFIEKVLGDDKDGKYLVEYLRCNMRVAEMPLLKVTTPQAIRRRVTHGFEKLSARLDEIYAAEALLAALPKKKKEA